MIDLVLRGSTKATILTLLASRNLVDTEGNPAPGIDYCWWAGSGKLMTKQAVNNAQGEVVTPATYLTGQVMILRISTADDELAEGAEQWERSKIARFIKNNGSPGNMGGIPYYEIANVRLFRFSDVQTRLAQLGVPGHEWMGGNNG